MRELGLQSYRFSISWSRVLPNGIGPVNEAGMEFYERLVDALLAAGIRPLVTLYHWDLPHALYCKGGWLNRDIAGWFADYTALIAARLGDRVSRWCTLNEASNAGALGHHLGIHAPGVNYASRDYFRVVHHMNLAHGRAIPVLRAHTHGSAQVGQAFNQNIPIPRTPDAAGIKATQHDAFDFKPESPWWSTQLWIDPLFEGDYSPAVRAHYGSALDAVEADDLRVIASPMDYFGWNYYMDWSQPQQSAGEPVTQLKWQVQPEGMYWGPKVLFERYKLPIEILENGLASMDWLTTEGRVPDLMRIDHMARHLRELYRAIQAGVDVRAYYYWSFLDNFEWSAGYLPRFGLVHVDYKTQLRTPKASATFYRDVIASRGANLSAPKN
jgi:beta-glucosidase